MIALLTPWSVCNKCLRRAVTRGPHPPPPTGEGYDRYSGNIRRQGGPAGCGGLSVVVVSGGIRELRSLAMLNFWKTITSDNGMGP